MEEVAGIQEGFKLMDTSNKGKINIDELKIGLHKLGHQIPDTDLHILMEAVSTILCYELLACFSSSKSLQLFFFSFGLMGLELWTYVSIVVIVIVPLRRS